MPAAAPSRPGAGSGSSQRTRLVWVAGAAALLVVAYLLVRGRGGATAGVSPTSGTPGAAFDSSAQQPNGGAASVPGNLPALVDQPDPLQQQVQQTDAGSTSQQSSSTAAATTTAAGYGGPVQTINGTPVTSTFQSGGTTWEQTAPGSDNFRPTPPQTTPDTNIHHPGAQI